MSIFLILYMLSNLLIWGIVAFRQKGGKYFLFFLILISGDLITMVTRYFLYSFTLLFATNYFYVISALLRFVSVQEKKITKFTLITILIISILTVALEAHGLTYKQEFVLLCFFHFLLLFKFLQNFIVKFIANRIIDIFLICIIFYEITSATKYFGLITGFANAAWYFYATTVFEILIGLVFCTLREDNPRLLINLDNFQEEFLTKE
jgi:hypothetical protein